MTNYARIINNVAIDVSTDPASQFYVDLAAEFVAVPAQVQRGWITDGKTWTAPVIPTPAPTAEVGNLQPTPPQFMLLLTLQERAAIRAAAPNDPVVNDLLLMLNDPRLTFVDLTNVSVQEAVQYMTTTKTPLLTADRVKRILVGLPPQATYQ